MIAARRGLVLYFTLVVIGTAACQLRLIHAGDAITKHTGLVLLLMWTPGAASIITRLVLREGFADVSFRLRGPRVAKMALIAWIYPVIVGSIAYGAAWVFHLEHFRTPTMAKVGLEHAAVPVKLVCSILINLSIGTVLSAISAGGEELGWRGYMLTRLVDAKIPRPVFISGVIWASWHLPLILTGQYAAGPHPTRSAALFAIAVIASSYVVARARLESGSLWPAVIFHATWNAVIQGSFDVFTVGGDAARTTTVWTGESGILVVCVEVIVAMIIVRHAWPIRHTPTSPDDRRISLRTA